MPYSPALPGRPRAAGRLARGPELAASLAARLTARDRWLLRMLHEHRVLTTTQITELAFGTTRAATARLLTLYQHRAVDRFRPLAPAGSAPLHFILDEAGAQVLAAEDGITTAELGYRRDRALAIALSAQLAHTTGANGFFTALAAAARASSGQAALGCWWSERRCAAVWGDLARPDGYGRWREQFPGHAAVTADFFLEFDNGTENLRRLIAKLAGYRNLAARTGIPTPVLFWLPTARREAALRARLAGPPPHGTPGAASAAAIPGVPVSTAAPGTAPGGPGPAGRPGCPPQAPGRGYGSPSSPRPAPSRIRRRPGRPVAWRGIPPTPSRPPGTPSPAHRAPRGPVMTDHTARAIRAAGLLAAACAACAGCSLLQSPAASPAPARHPAHATAPASPGLAAILPFSPSRLQAAAAVAGRFAGLYGTWSWRQPPAAWLAGLRPMASSGLFAALARAADIPGVLAQRDHARQAAACTATAVQIRDLTTGSVTFTVAVRQVITSTSGTSQTVSSFAVTLTPQAAGWAVYDIEPASAGNS